MKIIIKGRHQITKLETPVLTPPFSSGGAHVSSLQLYRRTAKKLSGVFFTRGGPRAPTPPPFSLGGAHVSSLHPPPYFSRCQLSAGAPSLVI